MTADTILVTGAAGASEKFGEGHDPETHLIPCAFKAVLGKVEALDLYGGAYRQREEGTR
jgi:UDP-glucose 4-epimerase